MSKSLAQNFFWCVLAAGGLLALLSLSALQAALLAVFFVAIFALPKRRVFIFGFFLPWSSVFGAELTLAIGAFFACIVPLSTTRISLWWARYVVVLHLSWLFVMLYESFPIQAYIDLSAYERLQLLSYQITQGVPNTMLHLRYFLMLSCALVLFSWFSVEDRKRSEAVSGMILGVPVALAVFGFQFFTELIDGKPIGFWYEVGRWSGTFSDPNAFGIAGVLLMGAMLSKLFDSEVSFPRVPLFALIMAWLLVVPFSGSRAFLLGVSLVVLLSVPCVLQQRRFPKALTWFALMCGVAIAISMSILRPPSLDRLLQPIMTGNWGELFHSRMVFNQACLQLFSAFPLLGAGPFRFELWFPSLSGYLGYSTGSWVDNPNNFYLGLLAEFGFVGLLVFAVTLCQVHLRRLSDLPSKILRVTFLVYCILLLFGPHQRAVEVMLIASLLAASTLQAPIRNTPWFRAMSGVVLVLICLSPVLWMASERVPSGAYPPQQRAGVMERWFSERGNLVLSCTENRTQAIALRAPFRRVTNMYLEGYGELQLRGSWMNLAPIECSGDSKTLSFNVRNPSTRLADGDARVFGFRLKSVERKTALPPSMNWSQQGGFFSSLTMWQYIAEESFSSLFGSGSTTEPSE